MLTVASALAILWLLVLPPVRPALGQATPPRALPQPNPTDQLIQFHQGKVAQDPDDFLAYNRLGAAYIQKARETGDITYYRLTEQAVQKSLALVPHGPAAAAAITSLAIVEIARHRFAEALAAAQRAVELGGGQPSPHAIVADAYLELGEYDKAGLALSRLLGVSAPLRPHSRLAHLQFLKGDARGGIDHMRRAVGAAIEANAPKENLAWSHVELGQLYFQGGDLARADRSHQDALATFPGYHRARAGLARVRAAQGKYEEAIDLYRKAIGVIPLPEYAAALGDVYGKTGRADDARRQYQLVEYIGYLNALNKVVYNRELALFYADHDLKLPEALALAEKELEVRRDIYTWDVLAWARLKNGKPQEALAAMTEALKLGTRDARLFFHAGLIHRHLRQPERAREYLQRALSLNRHFHPIQGDVAARVLAELQGRAR